MMKLALTSIAMAFNTHCAFAYDVLASDALCGRGSGAFMADTSLPVDAAFLAGLLQTDARVVARYLDYFPATEHRSTEPDEPDPQIRKESRVGKTIRQHEIAALRAFAMDLVLVFQHHNDDARSFAMQPSRGYSDGMRALDLVKALGLHSPTGGVIYFGVDQDFVGPKGHKSFPHSDNVLRYFDAVAEAFLARNSPSRIGVYGSGYACEQVIGRLRSKFPSVAGYCWLSNAAGHWGSAAIRDVFDQAPKSLATEAAPVVLAQHREGTCEGLNRPVDFSVRRPGVTDVGAFSLR